MLKKWALQKKKSQNKNNRTSNEDAMKFFRFTIKKPVATIAQASHIHNFNHFSTLFGYNINSYIPYKQSVNNAAGKYINTTKQNKLEWKGAANIPDNRSPDYSNVDMQGYKAFILDDVP